MITKVIVQDIRYYKSFFCPVNGWDCPYWNPNGTCAMVAEGYNPVEECDDASCFYDEDENPFVWIDEDGNVFEHVDFV